MRVLFWNMRGFGKASRRGQLKSHITKEKIDIIGLQETVRQDFSDSELRNISGNANFQWQWLPANGKSGGILMGVKGDLLEVEESSILNFCITMSIRNRITNFRFIIVTVYGPAHHDQSRDFLEELEEVCDKASLPIVIGGDFNLIREAADKSSDHIDRNLINMFNSFIGTHQLRELARSGPRFTWSNKRANPVLANLDRILVSTEWEERFPLCLTWSLTRAGSNHAPIILDTGEHGAPRPRYFHFENQWLLLPDFRQMVEDKWQTSKERRPIDCYSLDGWHGSLCHLRQHLNGWNRWRIGQQNKEKDDLIKKMGEIDKEAELRALSMEDWLLREELESKLELIYQMEEIYWQQRIGDRWTIQGDSNSKFLHQYANGRRRKNTIITLDTEQGEVQG